MAEKQQARAWKKVIGVALAILLGASALVVATGLPSSKSASADDLPPITYTPTVGPPISIPGVCASPGVSATFAATQSGDWHNVPYSTEATPDEWDCAKRLLVIMKDEADSVYGSLHIAATIQPLLLPTGRGDLTSLYQVYLDNLDVSILFLEALSHNERGSCEVTRKHLLIVCDDKGEGSLYVPGLLNLPLPSHGAWSSLGSMVTYGNVTFVNGDANWSLHENEFLADDPASVAPWGLEDLHHEQVHAQEWAHGGLNFGMAFLNDAASGLQMANQKAAAAANPFLYAPSWYSFQVGCNQLFEKAANLYDGGYVLDGDVSHNWTYTNHTDGVAPNQHFQYCKY
jgi:hypothetical protein